MHLRSVHLRNWRSYRNARFDFPAPEGARNVILVRAPNEYGKTSFFEAVALGLFGRHGLSLAPRVLAAPGNGGVKRLNITYSNFLKAAFHRRAIALGEYSCSVTLEFEDEAGEAIEIRRTWYFYSNGEHKPNDDEILIYEGGGRRPVAPPAAEIDRDRFYADFVSRKFISPSLAEFYLFDGEQIQRYANLNMEDQIREAIEGLLGLPVLKNLKKSLGDYARARRSKSPSASTGELDRVENEIEIVTADIEDKEATVRETSGELRELEKESDELSLRIGGREGSMARVTELVKDEERFEAEAQRVLRDLMDDLAGDVALALCGASLRESAILRLRSEDDRERWEAGKREGDANLDRYLGDLSRRLGGLEPPVESAREREIVTAAREAWNSLWHPAPDGCADHYRHSGLMGTARGRALDRLEGAARSSAARLRRQIGEFDDARAKATAKKREWQSIEQAAPEIQRLVDRLAPVKERIGGLRATHDEASRAKESLGGRLAALRQEKGRMVDRMERGAADIRRAEGADVIADLIDEILKEAVPTQCQTVAEAMTGAWKSMSHMDDRVEKIEISPECRVRMLNKKGEDVHGIQKSAGASQIFTQSLIWAVTRVSGWRFPFVVDTPLARLSRENRLGVLRTFPDRAGQVILLSTDEEVVDDKLEAIRHRVAAAYQLRATTVDGVVVTTVEAESL